MVVLINGYDGQEERVAGNARFIRRYYRNMPIATEGISSSIGSLRLISSKDGGCFVERDLATLRFVYTFASEKETKRKK